MKVKSMYIPLAQSHIIYSLHVGTPQQKLKGLMEETKDMVIGLLIQRM